MTVQREPIATSIPDPLSLSEGQGSRFHPLTLPSPPPGGEGIEPTPSPSETLGEGEGRGEGGACSRMIRARLVSTPPA